MSIGKAVRSRSCQKTSCRQPRIAAEAFMRRRRGGRPSRRNLRTQRRFLRNALEAYVGGEPLEARVRATYPFVRITTSTHARSTRASLMASSPARHVRDVGDAAGSLSRLFHRADRASHPEPWRAGRDRRIGRADPHSLCLSTRHQHHGEALTRDRPLRDLFDTPDLATIDDAIVNGTLPAGPRQPLAMFRAARVDYSLPGSTTTPEPIRSTSRTS